MARQTRYTLKDLQADIKELNQTLIASGYYLYADSRNGYTALDEYRVDPSKAKGGICVANIECGSPRECLAAANAYTPREA